MGFSILKDAAEFLREKENRKRWLVIFLCLALLVTVGTVAVLAAPGHAMTNTAKVLNCQVQVHVHDQNCLNEEGSLICGEADYVVHTHNDDCYDSAGVLVCRLPAVPPHEHDASCYTDVKTLICGQEENPGHVHGEDCYDRQRNELICTTEEHVHNESCYNREEVLICDKTEQEHVHSDDCYTVSTELSCGLEENGEHTQRRLLYREPGADLRSDYRAPCPWARVLYGQRDLSLHDSGAHTWRRLLQLDGDADLPDPRGRGRPQPYGGLL